MEPKKTQKRHKKITKIVLRKKEQSWGYHNPRFPDTLQSYSNQNSMVLAQNRLESAGINPCLYGQLICKKARIYMGEKTVSSVNGVEKTGQLHAKEGNWTTFLHHTDYK